MLRNILGPVFNFNLDQFLTLEFCYFFFFLVFWGAETPIFIVFSAKNAKLQETQKTKKTLFVNTIVLTVLVKMSVFFFLHFWFLLFLEFPCFSEMFLIGFPKSKNTKNKASQTKNNNNKKTRCKAKRNEMLWFKTTEDNKQKNKNKRTSWNKKANTTKRKSKSQKEKMKNRKEERKEQERDKEREREERGEAQKRLKRNKGRHWKINKKCPFLGGKQVFLSVQKKPRKESKEKKKNKNQKKQKQKENKEGLGPSEVALWATSPDP